MESCQRYLVRQDQKYNKKKEEEEEENNDNLKATKQKNQQKKKMKTEKKTSKNKVSKLFLHPIANNFLEYLPREEKLVGAEVQAKPAKPTQTCATCSAKYVKQHTCKSQRAPKPTAPRAQVPVRPPRVQEILLKRNSFDEELAKLCKK
jgi:hypothetical protein